MPAPQPARVRPTGTGPGPITPDGCAVEFYALLPDADDVAAVVSGCVAPGGTVLELGAGAGRVTRALVRAGLAVTAVDESADMLARIEAAEIVLASIETLRLDRQWDAVVLASQLVNTPDPSQRNAFVATCAAHVAPDGCVLLERHPPSWFATAAAGSQKRGDIVYSLTDVSRPEPGLLTATVAYDVGDRRWTQTFTTSDLSDDDAAGLLADHGLRLAGFLDERRAWLKAVPDGRG